MKVLVCVKRVVDPNVQVQVRRDGTGMALEGVRQSLNPFDEVATEAAVQLKEQGLAQDVLAVSVGEPECREVLRTALAIGADRALLVQTEQALDSLGAARHLASVVRREAPDLVLVGKQSTDHDYGQTGPLLAALLGWAHATCVSQLAVQGRTLEVACEAEEGRVRLQLALPALLTVDLRLNTPRYASLPAMMKAKRKPLETLEAQALGVAQPSRVQWLGVREPPRRAAASMAASAQELVNMVAAARGQAGA